MYGMDLMDLFGYPDFGYGGYFGPMDIQPPDDEFQDLIRECVIEYEVKHGRTDCRRATRRDLVEAERILGDSWW